MTCENPSDVRGDFSLKPIIHGLSAAFLLFLTFFGLVGYLESVSHAWETFLSTAFFMVPLMAGFGFQVGLYSYARQFSRRRGHGSREVTASGGLSAGSMASCCLHHAWDVLPFVGIAGLTSALATFQPLLLAVGLASNAVGSLTLLNMIRELRLYDPEGVLAGVMHVNLGRLRNLVLALSPVILVAYAWGLAAGMGAQTPLAPGEAVVFNLPPKILSQGGVEVTVEPLPLSPGREVRFRVTFDTHSGSLDLDMAKAASLEDGRGNAYAPKSWEGSPPGGHHREGIITFPPLSGAPESIRLTIRGGAEDDPWLFSWMLAR